MYSSKSLGWLVFGAARVLLWETMVLAENSCEVGIPGTTTECLDIFIGVNPDVRDIFQAREDCMTQGGFLANIRTAKQHAGVVSCYEFDMQLNQLAVGLMDSRGLLITDDIHWVENYKDWTNSFAGTPYDTIYNEHIDASTFQQDQDNYCFGYKKKANNKITTMNCTNVKTKEYLCMKNITCKQTQSPNIIGDVLDVLHCHQCNSFVDCETGEMCSGSPYCYSTKTERDDGLQQFEKGCSNIGPMGCLVSVTGTGRRTTCYCNSNLCNGAQQGLIGTGTVTPMANGPQDCTCPNHWLRENETCYLISMEADTWNAANSRCHYNNGTLLQTNIEKGLAIAKQYGKRAPEWMWVSLFSKTQVFWGNGTEVEVERGDKINQNHLEDFIQANEVQFKNDLKNVVLNEFFDFEKILEQLEPMVNNYLRMINVTERGQHDKYKNDTRVLYYLELVLQKIEKCFWQMSVSNKMDLQLMQAAAVMIRRLMDYYHTINPTTTDGLDDLTVLVNLTQGIKNYLRDTSNVSIIITNQPITMMNVLAQVKEMNILQLLHFYVQISMSVSNGMLIVPSTPLYPSPMTPLFGSWVNISMDDQMQQLHFVYPPSVIMQCGAFAYEICMKTGQQNILYAMFECNQPRQFICQTKCQVTRDMIDECKSNPCMHNSTCINQVNSFFCLCRPGYNGLYCEQNINECLSSPCSYDSTCVDLVNGYRCEYGPCYSNPCQNGGSCYETSATSYRCYCLNSGPNYDIQHAGLHCEYTSNCADVEVIEPFLFSIQPIQCSFNISRECYGGHNLRMYNTTATRFQLQCGLNRDPEMSALIAGRNAADYHDDTHGLIPIIDLQCDNSTGQWIHRHGTTYIGPVGHVCCGTYGNHECRNKYNFN